LPIGIFTALPTFAANLQLPLLNDPVTTSINMATLAMSPAIHAFMAEFISPPAYAA
jgi:hypothetical protein